MKDRAYNDTMALCEKFGKLEKVTGMQQEKTLIIPEDYDAKLNIRQTEEAIKLIKDRFERELAAALNLHRISAPLFVRPDSGLNDNLNGVERPVQFDIKDTGEEIEIIHSLAKWKRMALRRYGYGVDEGIYTDMNAIRRDEDLDNLHSIYVDQWDWELTISREERTPGFLREIVLRIYGALQRTEQAVLAAYPCLCRYVPEKLHFMTTQELEDRYPSLSPKQREDAITKELGAVFLMQIGGKLKSGQSHDGRAPDYDDWSLNGDILVYYPVLQRAFELSSMGIRVDEAAMKRQLELSGCPERAELRFHKELLEGKLPLTAGGGIGQSRLCMLLLGKAHIGEVQASIWPRQMRERCEQAGIWLL